MVEQNGTQDSTQDDLKVTLSLDDLERDKSALRPPFVVELQGEKFPFTDPQEIDWLDLTEMDEDPARFLSLCLANESQVAAFYEARIPGWKMNKLMDAFLSHYGLTRRGNRFASRR